MNFSEYLHETSTEINHELTSFLKKSHHTIAKRAIHTLETYTPFFSSVHGGKCIRGTLVKLGYQMYATKYNSEIVKIAAGFEIIHTGLLIHDDIIDKSPLRRGKPSVYKALGGNHYGVSQALCLGDLAFFLAIQRIAESNFDPALQNKALRTLTTILTDTIAGQIIDTAFSSSKTIPAEKEIIHMYALKTATYSIVGPLLIGAILGNANDHSLNAIRRFGRYVGIAFQIQDDILGVFGKKKTIGKSITSDVSEGKKTLLLVYAHQYASATDKKNIEKYYGKKDIRQNELLRIKAIFEKTGALQKSTAAVHTCIKRAKKIIPSLTDDKHMQSLYSGFLELLEDRTY